MRGIIDRFFGDGNDVDPDTLPSPFRAELDPWIERFEVKEGTAFLPRVSGQSLRWYGLTPGGNARREMEGLLLQWLGATYTDLDQHRGLLDLDDPFDAWLEGELPGRVVRFEVLPRGSAEHRQTVRQRLGQLVALLDARPPRPAFASFRLKALVDDLHKTAGRGDRDAAVKVLDAIRERRLVDEANLLFLRVRMLHRLQAWEELLAPDLLDRLARMRVPPGITHAISEAIYQVHLASADGDADALRQASQMIPPEVSAIVGQAGSALTRADLVVQVLTLSDRPLTVERLLDSTDDIVLIEILGHGGAMERGASDDSSVTEASTAPTMEEFFASASQNDHSAVLTLAERMTSPIPLLVAQTALQSAHTLGDQRSATRAVDVAARDLGDLQGVVWSHVTIEQIVQDLIARQIGGAPTTWEAWLRLAADGDERAETYPPSPDWAPAPAELLLDLTERAVDAIPSVVGVLRTAHRDTLTAEQRARLGYTCLFAITANGSRREPDRLAAGQMLEDILDTDDVISMSDVVETLAELVPGHMGSSTVEWAVDIIGEVVEAARGDDRALAAQLAQTIVDSMRPCWTSLSRSSFEALNDAVTAVGTSMPHDLIGDSDVVAEPLPYAHLRGQHILIHSLMERSTRRAAAVLRRLGGGTDVALSHDHVCTPSLTERARRADVAVIVTVAAKHPATQCIEAARHSSRTVIHVNSVGTSAILRALATPTEDRQS